MKKLFLLAFVLTLASCGQNNVTDTNTGASVPTEKVETKTAEVQVVDKNAELRASLEKMAEEYKNTQKYISFTDFEKATGLKLGNDAEVLPEDKENAGVGVDMVKNDFVFLGVSMGSAGAGELYQLKDGKLEFVIGGNGDASESECKKVDELGVPEEFPVKRLYCNYEKNSDKNADLRAILTQMMNDWIVNQKAPTPEEFSLKTGLQLGYQDNMHENEKWAEVIVIKMSGDFVGLSFMGIDKTHNKEIKFPIYEIQNGKLVFLADSYGDEKFSKEECEILQTK